MNNENNIDLTKLERLAALLRDDGLDPEKMDSGQITKYLSDHKVDMSGPQKRFASVLKKARASYSLELARERRLKAIDKSKTVLSASADAIEAVKARVREMIKKLDQHNPGEAQVYAREFEKATPEDLASLEEDLTLLEIEASEDEKGDSKNPR